MTSVKRKSVSCPELEDITLQYEAPVTGHQVWRAVFNVVEDLKEHDLALGLSLVFVDVGHDLLDTC